MKNTTYILVFDVETEISRDFVENLEGTIYENMKDVIADLKNESLLQDDFIIFTLSDFTLACNDQVISTERSWITYINILN